MRTRYFVRGSYMLWLVIVALMLVACAPIGADLSSSTGTSDLGEAGTNEAAAAAPEAPTVTFTATEYAYDGPAEIAGGLTRIELVNDGEQPHGLWMFNLADGKGLDDVMGFMEEMEVNPEIPAWLSFYGGVSAPPGASAAYTVDLPAGNYLLISIEGDEEEVPDVMKGMSATLTVTESVAAAAAPPAADMKMEMVDFSFVVDGTPKAGPQIIEVMNTGMEPHEIALLSLTDGATVQDAIEFMMAGEEAQGPPSFDFYGGTGPQSAGVTAWYETDFAPGEYGLICFISSAANEGAPHFMLGMTAQMSVVN